MRKKLPHIYWWVIAHKLVVSKPEVGALEVSVKFLYQNDSIESTSCCIVVTYNLAPVVQTMNSAIH